MSVNEQLDNTLVARADDKRRAILRRLAKGDARVTALAEPLMQATRTRYQVVIRNSFLEFAPDGTKLVAIEGVNPVVA